MNDLLFLISVVLSCLIGFSLCKLSKANGFIPGILVGTLAILFMAYSFKSLNHYPQMKSGIVMDHKYTPPYVMDSYTSFANYYVTGPIYETHMGNFSILVQGIDTISNENRLVWMSVPDSTFYMYNDGDSVYFEPPTLDGEK